MLSEKNLNGSLSQFATRAAYGARQLSRVAWYVGHGVALRRLSDEARRRESKSSRPLPHTGAPVPERGRLYADMTALFQRDLAPLYYLQNFHFQTGGYLTDESARRYDIQV